MAASTAAVRTSISFVPRVVPRFLPRAMRFAPFLPFPDRVRPSGRRAYFPDYQTWLRIAAATTDTIMTPATVSAIRRVACCFRSFFRVLMSFPPLRNARIISLCRIDGNFSAQESSPAAVITQPVMRAESQACTWLRSSPLPPARRRHLPEKKRRAVSALLRDLVIAYSSVPSSSDPALLLLRRVFSAVRSWFSSGRKAAVYFASSSSLREEYRA